VSADPAGTRAERRRLDPSGAEHDLIGLMQFQQTACRDIGSVVYDRLVGHTISALSRPGPIRDLLTPHAEDPFGSALALRYLGAVHRLVLDGRAPSLAVHYPSVGGAPGADLESAFEAVVTERFAELVPLLELGVQTNEVGRSATMLGALLLVASSGLPLRVFELGASAGLNLLWDRFRYEAGGEAFGPPGAAVCFTEPWVDRRPPLTVAVEVVERRGCDQSPIDPCTDAGRLTLRSFVWPDLTHRFARLDAATETAQATPVRVDRADAVDWAAARLADPVPGTATVVMHSIVIQYLEPERRAELVRLLRDAGARATAHAPLAWVRLEPGRSGAELRITRWPGGHDQLLAKSTYHGPPVTWLG